MFWTIPLSQVFRSPGGTFFLVAHIAPIGHIRRQAFIGTGIQHAMRTLGSQKPKDDPGAMTFIARTPVTVCFMVGMFSESGVDVLVALHTPGVAPHVVEKVLNHISGTISGVAAVYNRYGYDREKREALETWGQVLSKLAADDGIDNRL